jgi:alpha-glucosidase
VHIETTAYSALDFRNENFHEVEVWAMPERFEFFARESLPALVTAMADRFGRQPQLPDWAIEGAIVGLKDGEQSFSRLESYLEAGAVISALWCEDWVGLRHTSFGARLFWNWQASGERYPGLREKIAELGRRGIRFLGYVNPYLCEEAPLFAEAGARGFLAKDDDGAIYRVDFGEFHCGVVDFTDPEAARWFEERILDKEMIDLGMAGWMADFGEYLPIELTLKSGVPAKLMHNAWPVLWAKINAEAIDRRGRTGDIVFFMRAGFTGIQRYCPLLWAGDQSVDFSRHDGLVTAIVGALSSGLLGNAYHHSDIGGYTSLFANVRTHELMFRWIEMAAFTPVMRTHEGNRPAENIQVDKSADILAHFARMTRIHAALKPYLRQLCKEAEASGLPLQRPLFLHHEDDPGAFEVWDAYLLGRDLLVAPVWKAGEETRSVYLPKGETWVHLWSGERHAGGVIKTVPAPIGQPAVWSREGAQMSALFGSLAG